MIKVTDLKKLYGQQLAVDHISFEIKKGEVVGFLGPNGAGKSTTMKIITGALAPTSGIAQVGGFDVFENPIEVKKKIGYLPETPPVYSDMYVFDFLNYVAQLKGVESQKLKAQVDMALEKTQLTGVKNRLIHNLSKGFRQRVGIAQALVSDPEILILDEPTVGLDPKQVSEIRHLINQLKGYHTIILSTHILPEVEATCERVIIINKGKIVAQDSLAALTKLRSGREKVFLSVRRSEGVFEGLKQLPFVAQVENSKESYQFEVTIQNQETDVDLLARWVLDHSHGLIEIKPVQSNLEEVFLNLTYGQKTEI